ncbi:MAG: YdcF family protein [Oscillospiraceae bacterium]|nr:YdcF family protein [Oscillospiraceae bacterium]
MKTKKKTLRSIMSIFLCLCILGITALTVINSIVKLSTGDQIISSEEAAKLEDIDCILVLGCFVKDDGRPSDMLFDRLTRGVELYDMGAAPKLLMSGDHGREEYDEVAAMKQFAIGEGIPSEDVFMDHAGFSTYESIYRAKEIFQADKILIVTQEYHLYRALYIANQLDVEAYGVSSDYHTYVGQFMRDFREMLARVKDCATCIFKPEPTYLGEAIPVFGDGNITNDDTTDFS